MASMHQWVERLNKEYVKVSDEAYNPFSSIMKRNDLNNDNENEEFGNTGDVKIDRLDINYINSIYDDNLTQRLINYNSSTNSNYEKQ